MLSKILYAHLIIPCLGRKSLQVIALVHTCLTHPLLEFRGKRIIRRVLLLVPVNILANWQAEFKKWIGNDIPEFSLYNYNQKKDSSGRLYLAEKWWKYGGVLYCSFDTFSRTVKNGNDQIKKFFQSPGPDRKFIICQFRICNIYFSKSIAIFNFIVVVLDEAHLMLKNNKSDIGKALSTMKTSRRIALTGTPLQNNLHEYYRLANWIRPGYLAKSESEFERVYVKKIMSSLMVRSIF